VDGGLQVEGWGIGGKSGPSYPFRSVGTTGPFVALEVGF
jgi:hypothetical protein